LPGLNRSQRVVAGLGPGNPSILLRKVFLQKAMDARVNRAKTRFAPVPAHDDQVANRQFDADSK
jgi:hypothetical protein